MRVHLNIWHKLSVSNLTLKQNELTLLCLEDCKNAADFRKKLHLIAKGTHSDISRIANEAMGKFHISSELHEQVVLPSAKKDTSQSKSVFAQIEREIEKDPKKLEVFLKILKDIGPPVDDYAKKIGKLVIYIIVLLYQFLSEETLSKMAAQNTAKKRKSAIVTCSIFSYP